MAWVVYPFSKNAKQKAPVVVVVHEIFGLSTWVRGVADQVAADGFIAVAPDFLSRVRGGPSTVELSADTARRLIAGVNTTERNTIIKAAANYAMMLPSAQQKYAVIGYCWGGTTTWAHGVNGGLKGFSGGVAFYGAPYTKGGTPATATTAAVPASVDADSLAKITQPIMLLNGSKDARIAALMPAVDSVMKAQKKSYTGINYEGAVHGFLRAQNDPRPTNRDEAEEAANMAATKDGWPRTTAAGWSRCWLRPSPCRCAGAPRRTPAGCPSRVRPRYPTARWWCAAPAPPGARGACAAPDRRPPRCAPW
jgi:carboxymethylenebutenolidase